MNKNIKVFNGVRDVTDKDQAMIRYYQLMSEQAEWNARRTAHRNNRLKMPIAIVPILFVFEVVLFGIYSLTHKRK